MPMGERMEDFRTRIPIWIEQPVEEVQEERKPLWTPIRWRSHTDH